MYQKNKMKAQMDDDMKGYLDWLAHAEEIDPDNYKWEYLLEDFFNWANIWQTHVCCASLWDKV